MYTRVYLGSIYQGVYQGVPREAYIHGGYTQGVHRAYTGRYTQGVRERDTGRLSGASFNCYSWLRRLSGASFNCYSLFRRLSGTSLTVIPGSGGSREPLLTLIPVRKALGNLF